LIFRKSAEYASGSSEIDRCVFLDAPPLFCALAHPSDLGSDSFACSRPTDKPGRDDEEEVEGVLSPANRMSYLGV
jgi:hypothetical protein